MIRLEKNAKPQILQDRGDEWTKTLVDKLAAGEVPTDTEKTRYRHAQIKEALIQETGGKCAYCESKLLHIHHGDVEHIYPKSLAPEKSFEWENLTLACEVCNQNKSNHDPLLKNIIDPYEIDPGEHLLFNGPLIFPKGTPQGASTRTLLDLNRGELAERRKEHLEKIMGIVDTVLRPDIPMETKRAIYSDLRTRESARTSPYSAMVRMVIEQVSVLLPPEIMA